MKIRLLGRPAVIDAGGRARPVRGHQSWAVLARVLLTSRPIGRRELASELFPDTVDPLGSLRWCLASLRRALDAREAMAGDPIAPNLPPGTEVDVHRLYDDALPLEQVGALLDGIEPRCAPQFSTWLLIERERTASLIDTRIRDEALRALSRGRTQRAIELSEHAVRRRPLDEGAHVLLVKSLTLAGRYEAALEHVETTEKVFQQELAAAPSNALRSAARRTVAAPPGGIGPRAVVHSLLEAGLAALAAGAVDAGVDSLRRAVAESQRCDDAQLEASALLELGSALVHAVRSHDDEGAVFLEQAVARATDGSDSRTAASALRELGYVDALAGRRPSADTRLKAAMTVADRDDDALAGVHAVMGFNLVDWGRIDAGLEHYRLSLEYATRAANPRREAWSLGLGGWGQLAAGYPEEAVRWLEQCLALIDELRWLAFRPWPLAVLAEARLRLRQPPRSLRGELEETFALSCQLGDPCWEGAAARMMAMTSAASDDLDDALGWIDEALRRCRRETDTYVGLVAAVLATRVELLRRARRGNEADAVARELLTLAAKSHMDGYLAPAVAALQPQ